MARIVPVNRWDRACVMAAIVFGAFAPHALAQAAAEAAGATSVMTSTVVAAPHIPAGSAPTPAPGSSISPHIVATPANLTEEKNRSELEARAGRDASRLLLRSTPAKAQVWVDGKAVGSTPLLLIVPPGKYKIELRGPRQEHAVYDYALLPKETREEVVKLQQLYPARVGSR